ncbi:MAG: AI-2E family transporter [Ilumatobacteraceae bacterium]
MHDLPGARGNDGGVILGGPSDDSQPRNDPEPLFRRPARSWSEVPWRTILATVGVVMIAYISMEVILDTVRIIAWIVIAGFFAIVLSPAVRWVESKVGGRRSLATAIVVFTTLAAVLGLLSLFLLPVRSQLITIITDLPGTVRDAAQGRGTVGQLVTKLHLNTYVHDHEAELRDAADRLSSSSFEYVSTVISGLIAFISITVITVLFLSQAESIGETVMTALPARRRESVRRIAVDSAGAISGYMIGNLLISLIAGTTAFICLVALGVPSPFVLALWVAFADLIPLVGAIIGAAAAVVVAFLHNSTAGIISLVFFIVYQQIESSVLYPAIMARRVKVNPLVVLLSVLLGVEIFGFLGALLAVPVSGALQVAIKAIWQEHRRGRMVLPKS